MLRAKRTELWRLQAHLQAACCGSARAPSQVRHPAASRRSCDKIPDLFWFLTGDCAGRACVLVDTAAVDSLTPWHDPYGNSLHVQGPREELVAELRRACTEALALQAVAEYIADTCASCHNGILEAPAGAQEGTRTVGSLSA